MQKNVSSNRVFYTRKEKKKLRKKVIFTFLFSFVLFLCIIFFLRHPYFQVHEKAMITGNQTILDEDIQDIVSDVLGDNFLFFLPRSSLFLLSTKKIEKNIKTSFPKIYNIDVQLKKNKTLSIFIEEREPHSLWCIGDSDDLSFEEQCFFADQKGYLYARAPYFSEGIFEKIYTHQELEIGMQVMDKFDFQEFFSFLKRVKSSYEIGVHHVVFDTENQIYIFLDKVFNEGLNQIPYFIFYDEVDYDVLYRNIELILNQKDFKKQFFQKKNEFMFVDLRIENQIRYKFNVEEDIYEKNIEKNI